MAIDASWYEKPSGVRERVGAGGVIVRVEGGKLLLALVRGDDLDGRLLPKGGVDFDESIEQAARREIEEEAGITELLLLADLGARERLSFDRSRWQATHYLLFLTTQTGGTPTDPRHAYAVEWYPLDALPTMFWPEQRALVEESRARIEAAVHILGR